MNKIKLYIASSIDGFIARENGSLDWLESLSNPNQIDHGYSDLLSSIDTIVMGRKTYESIGRALPGRRNIVISRDENYQKEGIDTVTSVEQALALVDGVEEIMVIGGGAIYQHCLPAASRLYITHIKAAIDGDTRFPDYDDGSWLKVSSEVRASDEKNDYQLDFCIYQRR